MKEDEQQDAYDFWRRVDTKRDKITLGELSKALDLKEQSIRAMRSACRIPKMPVVKAIADYLGTSTDFLLSGKESQTPPDRYDFPEVEFVRKSPEARALIRAIMQDETLLQALSAVVLSMERQRVQPGKTS